MDDVMTLYIRCANCGNFIQVDMITTPILDNADYTANCCEDPDYYPYEDRTQS